MPGERKQERSQTLTRCFFGLKMNAVPKIVSDKQIFFCCCFFFLFCSRFQLFFSISRPWERWLLQRNVNQQMKASTKCVLASISSAKAWLQRCFFQVNYLWFPNRWMSRKQTLELVTAGISSRINSSVYNSVGHSLSVFCCCKRR